MRALAAALLALVSACSQAHPPAQPAGRPITSLNAMIGEWSIVRFEQYEPVRLAPTGQPQAYVIVRDGGLGFMLGCNSSGAEARLSRDGTLSASSDGIQTLVGCGRELEARDGRFFGFFRSKPKVRWAGSGRIALTNGPTTLLLERPETRRLSFAPTPAQLAGRWVPQMAYPRPGLGYGFQNADLRLSITSDTMRYSACPQRVGRFRYDRDARLVGLDGMDWSQCPLDGRSGYSDEPAKVLLHVLANNPVAELTERGGLTLSAGAVLISLRREADLAHEQEQLRRAPPPLDVVNPPPPALPAPHR